jgi:hypothetical protein
MGYKLWLLRQWGDAAPLISMEEPVMRIEEGGNRQAPLGDGGGKEQGAEGGDGRRERGRRKGRGEKRADRKSKRKNRGVERKKKEERVLNKPDLRKRMNEKMISTTAFTK